MLPILLTLTSLASAGPVVIDATPYVDRSLADCGIQKAINALPAEGGVVQLPEGRFVLERYLYLKSGTTLRGKGRGTVLVVGKPEERRVVAQTAKSGDTEITVVGDLSTLKPGMIVFAWRSRTALHLYVKTYKVQAIRGQTVVLDAPSKYELRAQEQAGLSWGMATLLAAPAKKGERKIQVEHPELFGPGYAVQFNGKGDIWDHHFNVVTTVEGNTLTLERPLTVDAETGALVLHAHCMITADGEKNIAVEDLDVEGWPTQEKPRWGGFALAGIHFVRCEGTRLIRVEMRYWNGDGFSIQAGRNARVENCAALECRGHGFHPGTGLTNAEFLSLLSFRNSGDGLYYCWHNDNVNVRNCVLRENGAHGIGGLGDPGDMNCTVEGNTIEDNGRAGIEVNGGKVSNSIIRNNTVRNNSRSKPGQWPGIALFASSADARAYTVEGNTVESTLDEPTQWVGIEERNGNPVRQEVEREGKKIVVTRIADENRILRNLCRGHKTADIILIGPATVAEGNTGTLVRNAP